MDISKISTLTFDCYGTLIDWESGIWDGLQPLLLANGSQRTRHASLEDFAKCESALQAEFPAMRYPDILAKTHARLAALWGYETNEAMDTTFGAFVPYWPAFPDSADALRRLSHSFNLVIISNVDRASFAGSNARLGVSFDAIYTAEDIGSYKPNPANFPHMLSALKTEHSVAEDQILHVAQSLFHDIKPAKAVGLPSVWIDRQKLEEGGSWGATAMVGDVPRPDRRFTDLQGFADWACAAKQA